MDTLNTVNSSITELQSRLDQMELQRKQLEQQKKDLEENQRKNDCDKNLQIVKNAYENRNQKVKDNRYSKSCIVAKFIDQDMVEPLEAIYNLLSNMNNRLIKLEELNK